MKVGGSRSSLRLNLFKFYCPTNVKTFRNPSAQHTTFPLPTATLLKPALLSVKNAVSVLCSENVRFVS